MGELEHSFYLRLDVEAASLEDAERKLGEALDVMEGVQGSIYVIPEQQQRGAVSRAEKAERELREFQEGLTKALNAHGVPAMPSWPEAIDYLARHAGQ